MTFEHRSFCGKHRGWLPVATAQFITKRFRRSASRLNRLLSATPSPSYRESLTCWYLKHTQANS
jgi:hypothetical protein